MELLCAKESCKTMKILVTGERLSVKIDRNPRKIRI